MFDNLPVTPDVLVNNAGISGAQQSIVDSQPEEWWADWVSIILLLSCANLVSGRRRLEDDG